MKKRRLEDLYVVGKVVEFDDGHGDPLSVYLRKLTPVDMEHALRNANAAKARYVAGSRDTSSEAYQEVYASNSDILADREACVALAADEALSKRRSAVESELAEESEWADDDYLQGLRDAWAQAVQRDEQNEDEAQHVLDELRRFNEGVEKVMEEARAVEFRVYESWSNEELADEAVRLLMRVRAGMAWLNELRLSEIWLSLRESATTKARYYEQRSDLNDLPTEILRKLLDEYQAMVVEAGEGKDSQRTQVSSPSSAQPSEEETSASSGPKVVAL